MPITPLPTPAPSRNQPENEFVANANALFGALPTLVTEINAESALIDADRVAAQTAATNAAAQVPLAAAQVTLAAAQAALADTAADVAVAAANYRGDWNSATAYLQGQSVSHSGKRWAAKVNNTNVAPVAGATWLDITPASASLLAAIVDEKPSGTQGGTSSFSYVTRTLNTIAFDPGGIVTLSSNTFTSSVACGVTWSAPAAGLNTVHKTRLVRVSDGAVIALGQSAKSSSVNDVVTNSFGSARIAAGVAYRIEHCANAGVNNFGFGVPSSFGDAEIYTIVNLWS